MNTSPVDYDQGKSNLDGTILVGFISAAILLAGFFISSFLTQPIFGVDAAQQERVYPEVIYGDDNRLDLYDASLKAAQIELAKATAALVSKSSLKMDTEHPECMRLPGDTFGESFGLCSDEPFGDQPNPAFCSGFLVAPDVLVTAGHCIDRRSCDDTKFVFDFSYFEPDHDPTLVLNENIYSCAYLIKRELRGIRGTDYAVVRLDRPVTGRTPLQFRTSGTIESQTPLTMIGHPSGLPTKIAAGARMLSSYPEDPYFLANTDSYGGNSGSAVLNSETGIVEGILVRGESDFDYRYEREHEPVVAPKPEIASESSKLVSKAGLKFTQSDDSGCVTSRRCSDDGVGCRGEDVTRATEFSPYIPLTLDPNYSYVVVKRELLHQDLAIPDGQIVNYAATEEEEEETENVVNHLTVPLEFNEEGTVVDIHVTVEVTHERPSDLTFKLIAPDGSEAPLEVDYLPAPNNENPTTHITFGSRGYVQPALYQLTDRAAKGIWNIQVEDTRNRITGTLNAVGVELTIK